MRVVFTSKQNKERQRRSAAGAILTGGQPPPPVLYPTQGLPRGAGGRGRATAAFVHSRRWRHAEGRPRELGVLGVREAAVRACARTQQSALTTHSGSCAWWGPHRKNKQPSYHKSALIKCLKLSCEVS